MQKVFGIAIGLLLAACGGPSFATPPANTAPAACRDDENQTPAPMPGKWAVVLNFNHPRSTTTTRACLIRQAAGGVFSYAEFDCPVQNNRGGVAVGDGSAVFNNTFVINCLVNEGAATEENRFLMRVRLSGLGVLAARNEIVRSSSFNWQVRSGLTETRLNGEFEDAPFSNTVEHTRLPNSKVLLHTALAPGRLGTMRHAVASASGATEVTAFGVSRFLLANSAPLVIGQGANYEMHDLVIGVVGE